MHVTVYYRLSTQSTTLHFSPKHMYSRSTASTFSKQSTRRAFVAAWRNCVAVALSRRPLPLSQKHPRDRVPAKALHASSPPMHNALYAFVNSVLYSRQAVGHKQFCFSPAGDRPSPLLLLSSYRTICSFNHSLNISYTLRCRGSTQHLGIQ